MSDSSPDLPPPKLRHQARARLAFLALGLSLLAAWGALSAAPARAVGGRPLPLHGDLALSLPRLPRLKAGPRLALFGRGREDVRVVEIHYRAWDGRRRSAYVLYPADYRSRAPLPLIISPHGRGVSDWRTALLWWDLPAEGHFAVVCPAGQGRRLALYSWGAPGQIRDLARMPTIVTHELPWLAIDRSRVYAVGGSMGGQETLLLAARYPRLLAGAVAFDPATDMARRYRDFYWTPYERDAQLLARYEIGGSPGQVPEAYARRSPDHYLRRLAFSGLPIQIWWSWDDRIITDQWRESGGLYRAIKRLNPQAPVTETVGFWAHTREMHYSTRLPVALERFGLLSPVDVRRRYRYEDWRHPLLADPDAQRARKSPV